MCDSPQLISLSRKRYKIEAKALLMGLTDHPGIKAALKSHSVQRSTKNAYILLLGATGTGKSSTINFLLGQRKIAKVGDYASETNQINEYVIPVEMLDLGIDNSELHIIDTPGLADTTGIEKDARFMQSLEEFFKNHEELNEKLPNVVLIFGKFDDNRFHGEGSTFARVFAALDKLSKNFIDCKRPNVITVLTHAMSQKDNIRKHPEAFLDLYHCAIRNYSSIPEPIVTILAENCPEEYDLKIEGGYRLLPNGDYYPYNLFTAIQKLTNENGDPIGEAIIRYAFRNPELLKVSKPLKTQLVNAQHPGVLVHVQDLNNILVGVHQTDITGILSQSWEMVPLNLRQMFPSSLHMVQLAMNRHGIRTVEEIPRERRAVVDFLKGIPHNEAVLWLLQNSLAINVPQLPDNSVVGYCYSVINDSNVPVSIFKLGSNVLAEIGFQVPDKIKCIPKVETVDICSCFKTEDEYKRARLFDLNVDAQVEFKSFSFGTKNGYNVEQHAEQHSTNSSFSAVKEIRLFQLALKEDLELTEEFKMQIQNLPAYKPEHVNSVNTWKAFFCQFGTHVVSSAFGGGSLSVTKTSEFFSENTNASQSWFTQNKTGFAQIFSADVNASGQGTSSSDFSDVYKNAQMSFSGGDQHYHTSDLSSLGNESGSTAIVALKTKMNDWKTSIKYEPVILGTKMNLVPLSFYVRKIQPDVAVEIDRAASDLFQASLQYRQPPPRPRPPPREEILPPPPPATGSCLKSGTLILMADKSWKSINDVVAGDLILDKSFIPCKVLAKNYSLLGSRTFFGFSKESTFFTQDHMFIGTSDSIYVANKKALLAENPLMKFLDVKQMDDEFKLLKYDERKFEIVNSTTRVFGYSTRIILDSEKTDERVYYLIVDSPSGSYIANGFVCRHELPPFNIWPNTFKVFINVLLSNEANDLCLNELSSRKIETLAQCVARIFEGLVSYKSEYNSENNTSDKNENLESYFSENLMNILRDNTKAIFGLMLYSACGQRIANIVDDTENTKSVDVNRLASFITSFL